MLKDLMLVNSRWGRGPPRDKERAVLLKSTLDRAKSIVQMDVMGSYDSRRLPAARRLGEVCYF